MKGLQSLTHVSSRHRYIISALLASIWLFLVGAQSLASGDLAAPPGPSPPNVSQFLPHQGQPKSPAQTVSIGSDQDSGSKARDKSESSLWDKTIDWLFHDSDPHTLHGALKWAVIFILVLTLFLYVITGLAENLAKVLEAYKNSGLPITFSRKKKAQLLRRIQFCNVLAADLATLAKAENWNDQYFAELEAEVEAEGGYYSSAVRRLLRRPSRGLRRVRSLIEALESSTEQMLLLVGEPGSGKSVALRHLALQLARRGARSSDTEAKIPLYINLKEFSGPAVTEGLNADFIKEQVLENVRRGDADTAAYVRDNWDDYRQRGVWFFLFDSFDEIPAVLHAPSGSTVIRSWSEAIRTFLTGMSSCRGIVASREFKGPESLPWQKFRILSLSGKRQDQLIDRSFLESGQKEMVRQHLAAVGSTALSGNPLFLNLLCRFIKDEGHLPANDHDLLARHIKRLAHRDQDYIQRKYRITPGALIAGAQRLAVLFAEDASLSLAPTQDEIMASIMKEESLIVDIESLLSALVDVKIGRSDVRESRIGDRRFTFSHRRYQETLFVNYLAANPGHITPVELITNIRWREYAVALLQTEEGSVVAPIIEEAGRLLDQITASQRPIPIRREFGEHVGYFRWDGDQAESLLSLLQEGLLRRDTSIRTRLSKQVASLLRPRWEQGDFYDRVKVLKLGGLMPEECLVEYISYAINSQSATMKGVAFAQAERIAEPSPRFAQWVNHQLSDSMLIARSSSELRRTEALAARLPLSFRAHRSLRISRLLRSLLLPGVAMVIAILLTASIIARVGKNYSYFSSRSFLLRKRMSPLMLTGTQMLFLIGFSFLVARSPGVRVRYSFLFMLLTVPISLIYVFRSGRFRLYDSSSGPGLGPEYGMTLMGVVLPGYFLVVMLSSVSKNISTGFGIILLAAVVIATYTPILRSIFGDWRAERALKLLVGVGKVEICLKAKNLWELSAWLGSGKLFLFEEDINRSLSRLLMSDPKCLSQAARQRTPLFQVDWLSEPALPKVLAQLHRTLERTRAEHLTSSTEENGLVGWDG
jgi:energy-coupling factor transporter ATP-binding protein EcfA2